MKTLSANAGQVQLSVVESPAEELLRVGVRLMDQTHVIAQVDGQPLQPISLTPKFVRLLAKVSDQPRIRFHDLRHMHATHLLANSVHPKMAQERLGHSNVGSRSTSTAMSCQHAGGRRGQS